MKGFTKFVVLAVAGFGLGAGAAWLQQPHLTPPQFPAQSTAAPANTSPITEAPKVEATKEEEKKEEPAKTEEAAAPAEKTDAAPDKSKEVAAPEAEDLTKPEEATAKEDKDIQPPPPAAESKVEASPEVASNIAAARGDAPATVGGAFTLTDQEGKPVTEKSWPDKYLLVFFGFTNCPDVCPVTLDKLTSALDQLGADVSKVQPLFITVDSFRDKPAIMKEYVSHFHKSILGLTGTDAQLKAAQDAYKVYASRHDDANGHDYSFDHSAFIYFMAPDGQLAEIIKTDDKASDIADKIRPYLEGKKQAENPSPQPATP